MRRAESLSWDPKFRSRFLIDNLNTSKGSRQGNSGNVLELKVLTQLHHVPWAHLKNRWLPILIVESNAFLAAWDPAWKLPQQHKQTQLLETTNYKVWPLNQTAVLRKMGLGYQIKSKTANSEDDRSKGYVSWLTKQNSGSPQKEVSWRGPGSENKTKSNSSNENNPWGPIFKNRQNFVEMHFS